MQSLGVSNPISVVPSTIFYVSCHQYVRIREIFRVCPLVSFFDTFCMMINLVDRYLSSSVSAIFTNLFHGTRECVAKSHDLNLPDILGGLPI